MKQTILKSKYSLAFLNQFVGDIEYKKESDGELAYINLFFKAKPWWFRMIHRNEVYVAGYYIQLIYSSHVEEDELPESNDDCFLNINNFEEDLQVIKEIVSRNKERKKELREIKRASRIASLRRLCGLQTRR